MAAPITRLTPDFRVETDLLQLHIRTAPLPKPTALRRPGQVEIRLPADRWSGAPTAAQQAWLARAVAEELRIQARQTLIPRLHRHAERHGLVFSGVSIKNLTSRWGSCSARRHINLNLWLMLAPARLADYVLLHELAHLRELNHGSRFWVLLDAMTGGQARQLQREMRQLGKAVWQAAR